MQAIDKVLNEKWHGANYSQRIWAHNDRFINNIQSTIEDGIIQGHSVSRMAQNLRDFVKPSKDIDYSTTTLVRTETSHFMNQGQLNAYDEAGIRQYEFVAALSERTCDECAGLDGQNFNVSDATEGVNYPPLHPNCRCTTVMAGVDTNTRLAKNPETDENYKVDGNITFKKWKQNLTPEQKDKISKFVDNGGGSGIISVGSGQNMLKVATGGRRNEKPLTDEQINEIKDYAVTLGMPRNRIYYVDYDCTAYGSLADVLRIGTDVYPSAKKQSNPNSNVSMRGAIAHEIVGHRNAAMVGKTQENDILEEVQASLRAAKLTPNLSYLERMLLARDGLYRLHADGKKLRNVKKILYLE